MKRPNWKIELSSWLEKRRKIFEYKNYFIDFFINAFSSTRVPDKSWFGITNSSVSLIVGGIFLAAYVHSGDDKGIWLLLDREQQIMEGIEYKHVKSTKNSKIKLTWLHTSDIRYISTINQDSDIWNSFSLASNIVFDTPSGKDQRYNMIKGKRLLNSFWNLHNSLICLAQLNENFENEIIFSQSLTKKERLERIKKALTIPEKIEVKTTVYKRNADIIAEVLERANGYCEHCNNKAPFLKSDKTPYLEVHHKKPLSEGGEDTIGNTIALCPNCHRHAHYGSDTFYLSRSIKE